MRHHARFICTFYSFSHDNIIDTLYPEEKKKEMLEGCWREGLRKEERRGSWGILCTPTDSLNLLDYFFPVIFLKILHINHICSRQFSFFLLRAYYIFMLLNPFLSQTVP